MYRCERTSNKEGGSIEEFLCVLERLERSIAYTLESTPTEPESSGGITGITSLSPDTEEKRVIEKPAWHNLHKFP